MKYKIIAISFFIFVSHFKINAQNPVAIEESGTFAQQQKQFPEAYKSLFKNILEMPTKCVSTTKTHEGEKINNFLKNHQNIFYSLIPAALGVTGAVIANKKQGDYKRKVLSDSLHRENSNWSKKSIAFKKVKFGSAALGSIVSVIVFFVTNPGRDNRPTIKSVEEKDDWVFLGTGVSLFKIFDTKGVENFIKLNAGRYTIVQMLELSEDLLEKCEEMNKK